MSRPCFAARGSVELAVQEPARPDPCAPAARLAVPEIVIGEVVNESEVRVPAAAVRPTRRSVSTGAGSPGGGFAADLAP